ncbi:S9 family peptidase [Uliginosibacterium sp. 31-12]|uniref:alpha/beta hydrolase family protein n=1 Tax=Uliginosibacterium sp. 31-12 TaxID=3062781 RepID=UPI0026E24FCC|nr:alpha/beta fold hydrolase [Uliginosibacterium sp. 31-12]MDO6388346.1 alpha/beta fold hydrolase [Uliginosibacterium sp. 31-12]
MKSLLGLCLSMMLGAATAAPLRSQTPQAPFPYSEVELEFDSPYEAGVHLAGSLMLPPGKGPHPAVLLITGSGAQDRDETISGHKPFLVIADYLARRGIASLRVDDRGVGLSRGSWQNATTASFAGDARTALEVLRARPEIDAARVGLIGHSEGGVIAPMLAAEPANRVAFIIMLAGPGVTGDLLLQRQVEDLNLASDISPDVAKGNARIQAALNSVVLKHPDASPEALIDLLVAAMLQISPQTRADVARRLVSSLAWPWQRYFLALDPAPFLQRVQCPVLALNGEKDTQVSAIDNLPAIERALKAGGNRDVTLKALPGLNHLFQTAQTGALAEYGSIDETFSQAALKIMADWLEQRINKAKP